MKKLLRDVTDYLQEQNVIASAVGLCLSSEQFPFLKALVELLLRLL